MDVIKMMNNNKYWRCGEFGKPSNTAEYKREYEMVQLLWKTVQEFLRKLNIELQYSPGNPSDVFLCIIKIFLILNSSHLFSPSPEYLKFKFSNWMSTKAYKFSIHA